MKFWYSAGINLKANREPWWSNGGRELWASVTREKNEEELPRWRKLVDYREKKAILAKAKRILGWRKSIIKFHTENILSAEFWRRDFTRRGNITGKRGGNETGNRGNNYRGISNRRFTDDDRSEI